MFSFSPSTREPFRTSNSVAFPLPLLVASNVVGPAGMDSRDGEQPLSVSSTVTVWPPLVSSPPPHAANANAAASAAINAARTLTLPRAA